MDHMKEAKHKLTRIKDFRYYQEYIRKQLAGDFAIDLSKHIDSLQAELDAANVHIANLKDGLGIANMENEHYRGLLFSTQETSLASIKAQAINDLISECSHSQPIDGIAWMVIDEDDARKFAAKIGGGE